MSELVSNAVKHAAGEVMLTLSREGGAVCVEVCDDGPGFPENFDPMAAANTGLELVESFARFDLDGETLYETRPEGGGRVTVRFALPK